MIFDKDMTYDECVNYLSILEAGLSDTFRTDDTPDDNIIMLKIKAALSMAKLIILDMAVKEALKKGEGGDDNV